MNLRRRSMITSGTMRRKFGRLIFAFFLTIGSTAVLWLTARDLFRIQSVEVVGAQITVLVDQNKINKNLLFFPTQKVRAELLAANPLLKDIEIRKKFPHSLLIIAYMRDPIARLDLPDRQILVDRDGVVLGLAGSIDHALPVVLLPITSVPVGTTIEDARVRQSLAILAGMGKDIAIRSITNVDNSTLLAKTDTVDIYFPQNGETFDKVATLQTLIRGFRIKGTLPKVIDLRFDKPIVTF